MEMKCDNCIHKQVCNDKPPESYPQFMVNIMTDKCERYINNTDIQPVKHGRWKGYTKSAFYGCDDEGEPIYRDANFNVCSECGRKTVVKEKFCPNCGAKMDGGDTYD